MEINQENNNLLSCNELLRKLSDQFGKPKHYLSIYKSVKDPNALKKPPYSVLDSLNINNEDLSDLAKTTLDAINELSDKSIESDWLDFQWKLSAFLHIQDNFDVVIHSFDDPRILFQQYYFYFESRVVLAESFLAGLNGLYVASDALLRPFLEFSLLQNYYYLIVKKTRGFSVIQNYFRKGFHPSWTTILKSSLPNDSFCKPIRLRTTMFLKGLSSSSSHPYHPDFSPLQHRASILGHSLEGIFFWEKIKLVLDTALWIYYVNFPLLFYPVNVLRKFGFNSPVGLVADEMTGLLVKRSLPHLDFEAFTQYSSCQEYVINTLNVNERTDLTDDQIRETWDSEKGPLGDLLERYCKQMATLRGLNMAMAFQKCETKNLPDKVIEAFKSYVSWNKVSKRIKL